jgi:hypothetical protein
VAPLSCCIPEFIGAFTSWPSGVFVPLAEPTVDPGSVGVLVPALIGPFTPPLDGAFIDEPAVEPDPFV